MNVLLRRLWGERKTVQIVSRSRDKSRRSVECEGWMNLPSLPNYVSILRIGRWSPYFGWKHGAFPRKIPVAQPWNVWGMRHVPHMYTYRHRVVKAWACTVAYLSVCHAANKRIPTLLDEFVHLTGTCQLAGFPQVIGTLWQISDKRSAELAVSVYDAILDGGLINVRISQWSCTTRWDAWGTKLDMHQTLKEKLWMIRWSGPHIFISEPKQDS